MNFEQALAESYQQLYESTTMTPTQRRKVAAMGRVGWDIDPAQSVDDVIVMTKGAATVRITRKGEALMDSDSGPVDMTSLVTLFESDTEEELMEGVMDRVLSVFKRNKLKTNIYWDGGKGVIALTRSSKGYSLHHVHGKNVVRSIGDLPYEQAVDYIESVTPSMRVVRDEKTLLLVIGSLGQLAFWATAGVMAAMAFRGLFEAFSLIRQQNTATPDKDLVDSARERAEELAEKGLRFRNGEIEVIPDKAEEVIRKRMEEIQQQEAERALQSVPSFNL